MVLYLLGTPFGIPLGGRTFAFGPLDIVLIAASVGLAIAPARPIPFSAGVLFVAMFTGWATGSTLWSVDPARSIGSAVPLLEAIVMFLCAQRAFGSLATPSLQDSLRIFLVVLLAQMAFSIVTAAVKLDLSSPYYAFYQFKNSFQAPIGRSNHLALYLEFIFFYEVLLARRGAMLFACLAGAGLALTFSRAGLVLSAAAIAFILCGGAGDRKARQVAWPLAGLLTAGATIFVLTDIGRLLVKGGELLSRTAESRLDLWATAWEVAKDRPMAGIGFGTFEVIGGHRDIHNLVLELLCETGLIGLALLGTGGLLLLVALTRLSRVDSRSREGMALLFAGTILVLHSLVEPFFLDRSSLWVAVILAYVVTLTSSWRAPSATKRPPYDAPPMSHTGAPA